MKNGGSGPSVKTTKANGPYGSADRHLHEVTSDPSGEDESHSWSKYGWLIAIMPVYAIKKNVDCANAINRKE